MTLIECSPPFQWKPSFKKIGIIRRWMWGYFAVAWVPLGFNEFVEGLGQSGIDLYREGKIEHRPAHGRGAPR